MNATGRMFQEPPEDRLIEDHHAMNRNREGQIDERLQQKHAETPPVRSHVCQKRGTGDQNKPPGPQNGHVTAVSFHTISEGREQATRRYRIHDRREPLPDAPAGIRQKGRDRHSGDGCKRLPVPPAETRNTTTCMRPSPFY
jgi:hypothetical protein